MTTATAPDFDKINATIDGVKDFAGTVGEAVNKFSPLISEGLKANPLTAIFGYATDGAIKVANLTTPPIRLAFENAGKEMYGIAIRDQISKMEPNAVLDFAAEQAPELKEIAEIGKTDPEFAQAFKDMLVKDKQALPEIKAMLQEEGSGTTVEGLKALVKNPETRSQMTLKMQKVADSENYGFADMKNDLLETAQASSLKEFFHDLLANPNKFLEKMEGLLGKDSMALDFLRPALAVFKSVASVMREGLGEYAELGPKISAASKDYLQEQGNSWTKFMPPGMG